MKRTALILIALASSLHAATIKFALLGDPNQIYRGENVGPYSGTLGTQQAEDLYSVLCIDFLKTATWNTTYSGSVYGIADVVPGKTQAQLVEAAYLSSKLSILGGSSASTILYQGPISFAVWQIMDPVPGHVPVDPAAQAYVLEAQQALQSGSISAANFLNTRVFVPNNSSIQTFMTLTAQSSAGEVPEPGTIGMLAIGVALIGAGRAKRGMERGKKVA